MKRNSLILFLLLLIGKLSAQEVLTLESAVQQAIENNYNIKIATNNVDKAEKQHHIGNAGMLPTVSGRGSWNTGRGSGEQNGFDINNATRENFNYSATIQQTLFDGLTMFKTYQKQGEAVEFQTLRRQEEIENVISQVMSSYLEILRAQSFIKLNQESIRLSKERYDIVVQRKNAGAVTQLDVLNAQVDLATDSSSLLESERTLIQNRQYLLYLLNYPLESELLIQDTLIPNTDILNQLNKEMVTSNVLVKQSKKNEVITELDYQLYKAAKLPQLFMSGSYDHSRSESDFGFARTSVNDFFTFGLSANYTLFQGFKRNIQIQAAKIDQLNQQLQTEEVTQRIEKDYSIAEKSYQYRLTQLKLEQKNKEVFRENYELSKRSFEYGKITSIQLREAQLNLLQAERRLLDALLDAKTQEIELIRLTGNLISFDFTY